MDESEKHYVNKKKARNKIIHMYSIYTKFKNRRNMMMKSDENQNNICL